MAADKPCATCHYCGFHQGFSRISNTNQRWLKQGQVLSEATSKQDEGITVSERAMCVNRGYQNGVKGSVLEREAPRLGLLRENQVLFDEKRGQSVEEYFIEELQNV